MESGRASNYEATLKDSKKTRLIVVRFPSTFEEACRRAGLVANASRHPPSSSRGDAAGGPQSTHFMSFKRHVAL